MLIEQDPVAFGSVPVYEFTDLPRRKPCILPSWMQCLGTLEIISQGNKMGEAISLSGILISEQ